ncbi:DUF3981 domain-containing protein [Bacillus sp. 2205SS5-2]|uniref:DUF3981 domain-containing protein n=1 Tax=Bacillus sp. 2205SS5-2 TaxID=3109031 RepID=UPI00300744F8
MKFIFLLLLTTFMVPWEKPKSLNKSMILPILFWIVIGLGEYFILFDNNISSIFTSYAVIASVFIFVSLSLQTKHKNMLTLGKMAISLLLLGGFIYSSFIHSLVIAKDKYSSVEKIEKDLSEMFTEDDTPFSVPPETAKNKMKKVFGNLDKVSYFELGELTPQIVDGESLYVAPIEASGFFKARRAGFIPGYITMSGTNPDAEAKLIVGYEMEYVPSMYFGKNLERIVRQAEPDLIFNGEAKFEIDDQGNPYYTMTYGKKISLRSGFMVEGVVVVDPQTGITNTYTIKDAPSFIDGVLNHESASLENDYFGYYVHGFWNNVFSQSDVKIPTDWGTYEGVTPIFSKDGKMYYFTDFTSPKEGVDSALGYSLIDARTGVLYYYNGDLVKGIMDGSGANEVVDNSFKKEKWHGTMPVIYNVYGKPSWVVPVTDDGGLVRSYAVMLASNAKVFATGSTQREAFNKYKTVLSRGDLTKRPSSQSESKEIQGNVQRVYKETGEELTIVFVLLENDNRVYMISSVDFPYSIFTEVGDTVLFTYSDTGEQILSVTEFSNKSLE